MMLYSLRDINLSYTIFSSTQAGKIQVPALNGLSLDIAKNEFVVFLGANGSGKSTLGKLMAGLAPKFNGEFYYKDKLVQNYSRDIFSDVTMVLQEPQNQLLMPTVRKELAYPLENRMKYAEFIETQVAEYAEMFELDNLLDRSPDQLSGGQITALALASSLIAEPDVIILDEPDSHFDSRCKIVLEKFIDDYRGKKTIILITQYIKQADYADKVIVLKDGVAIYSGKPGDALDNTELLLTAGLISNNQSISNTKISKPEHKTEILSIENASYSYDKGRAIVKDINLKIFNGERVGLTGEMGSGKTTLGLLLAGLIEPNSGLVKYEGKKLVDYPESKLRSKVTYAMQFPERAMFEETVESDIAFGPRNLNFIDIDNIVNQQLQDFNITHLGGRHPFTLSGGERRRAALAGIMAMDADVIILDEPTAALDPQSVAILNFIIRSQSSKTFILISHDMDFIEPNCNRIIRIESGQILTNDIT